MLINVVSIFISAFMLQVSKALLDLMDMAWSSSR